MLHGDRTQDKPRIVSAPCRQRSHHRGLSLMELVVTLGLLGLLLTLGVQTWTPVRQKYQLQAQAQDLLSTLSLARSEAMKRGVRVTACVSDDGQRCQSQGHWTQGWIVFEDTDGNALRADEELLIKVHAALPLGLLAIGNSSVVRYVSYAPNSRSLLVSGAPQAGTITVCRASAQSTSAWGLAINFVGNAHLEAATLASCG